MASRQFLMWDTAGSPEWARWLYLACSGSQTQHSLWVMFNARGASTRAVIGQFSGPYSPARTAKI